MLTWVLSDCCAPGLAWAWLSSSHHQHCLERSPGLTGPGHPHWLISGGRINLGLASSNSGKYAIMGDWWNIRWGMSGIGRIVLWLGGLLDRGGKPSDVMTSHHNYRHRTSNYNEKTRLAVDRVKPWVFYSQNNALGLRPCALFGACTSRIEMSEPWQADRGLSFLFSSILIVQDKYLMFLFLVQENQKKS